MLFQLQRLCNTEGDGKMIMNNEYKESEGSTVLYFQVLSQHLEYLCQVNW